MKALFFSGMGRNPEAIEMIKKLLFKNLNNFTCWHVMGICQRKDKDYDQARRAYTNALKYAPENDNVMRDLAQMQIHLKEYAGFMETRRLILIKDPGHRDNWTSFATACYIADQH